MHLEISIHALREESDSDFRVEPIAFGISIHALREESDFADDPERWIVDNFNPRPP